MKPRGLSCQEVPTGLVNLDGQGCHRGLSFLDGKMLLVIQLSFVLGKVQDLEGNVARNHGILTGLDKVPGGKHIIIQRIK